MISLQTESMREEYALRLGLPGDSHPADVLKAVIYMTHQDVYLSDLQGLIRDMGGVLEIVVVPR